MRHFKIREQFFVYFFLKFRIFFTNHFQTDEYFSCIFLKFTMFQIHEPFLDSWTFFHEFCVIWKKQIMRHFQFDEYLFLWFFLKYTTFYIHEPFSSSWTFFLELLKNWGSFFTKHFQIDKYFFVIFFEICDISNSRTVFKFMYIFSWVFFEIWDIFHEPF